MLSKDAYQREDKTPCHKPEGLEECAYALRTLLCQDKSIVNIAEFPLEFIIVQLINLATTIKYGDKKW